MRTIGLALVAALAAHGQDADASKRADLQTLLELTGSTRALQESMTEEIVAAQMGKLFRSMFPAESSVEAAALVDDYAKRFAREFIAAFRKELPAIVEELGSQYEQAYTHDEIKGLIAFYRTPLGQKVLQTAPTLSTAAMKTGQARGEMIGKRLGEAIFPELAQKLRALPRR